jgi:hypothetical protein
MLASGTEAGTLVLRRAAPGGSVGWHYSTGVVWTAV